MAMPSHFICKACGTQFAEAAEPPRACAICQDSRQYIPPDGQDWTTVEKLRANHRNSFRQCEPDLFGIGTTPDFAIGQRALLLRTPSGNFLWDCISLLDDATVEVIRGLGGLAGIAISHPHYYSCMVEWSRAFGDAPIHLHAADREWVMRPDDSVQLWEDGQKELCPGVTLIRCGGHFAGGTVLHWADGAQGRGAFLTGDVVQVAADGMVSFMYSYPNMIPLSAPAVEKIAETVWPFAFERLYGAFWEREIDHSAHPIVAESARRYVRALTGEQPTAPAQALETERLTLRRITIEDAPFLLEQMNEPAFIRNIADRGLRTNADAAAYIAEKMLPSYKKFGFGFFVAELKGSGIPVGTCGLLKRETLAHADIGYSLLEKYWGQGFAYEAASAVLAYGRNVLRLPTIGAMTAPDNHSSIKLLQKLGLRFDRMIDLPGYEGESKLFL